MKSPFYVASFKNSTRTNLNWMLFDVLPFCMNKRINWKACTIPSTNWNEFTRGQIIEKSSAQRYFKKKFPWASRLDQFERIFRFLMIFFFKLKIFFFNFWGIFFDLKNFSEVLFWRIFLLISFESKKKNSNFIWPSKLLLCVTMAIDWL